MSDAPPVPNGQHRRTLITAGIGLAFTLLGGAVVVPLTLWRDNALIKEQLELHHMILTEMRDYRIVRERQDRVVERLNRLDIAADGIREIFHTQQSMNAEQQHAINRCLDWIKEHDKNHQAPRYDPDW